MYLLQLVQALRYERYDLINASVIESVEEEQNGLVMIKFWGKLFDVFFSTNGTYESFANAIGQTDSTMTDQSKSSSSSEVDSIFLFNPMKIFRF